MGLTCEWIENWHVIVTITIPPLNMPKGMGSPVPSSNDKKASKGPIDGPKIKVVNELDDYLMKGCDSMLIGAPSVATNKVTIVVVILLI